MEVITEIKDATLTAVPSGRIDSSTSSEFEEKVRLVLTDDITTLVIDMKNVDFISSKAIRIFLTFHREIQSRGKIVLTNINNSIREVLKLSALLEIFNVK